ncbi:MAG: 3,4-dihydroxy-2-butanone-4-phosphate synthase [Acidobacteria bacterium]|nr:3,4-dihydroxy-2-butanone-4-phosphate synthase [Acidobacteriota bacterium]
MSDLFATIPEAVEELRAGRVIIVVDDEDRENEGDLVCAAEKVTPGLINFMAKHGRGLICLSLTEERCDQLQLPLQVGENTSKFGTAFTISIEAREGVTTGISAADRARTVLTAVDPKTTAEDLARPGHIFPLRARRGGVLVRAGQTEASVDLARIAGLQPSGVLCEIMNDDGSMARLPQLKVFARDHHLRMVSVADIIHYRLQNEALIRRIAERELTSIHGPFRAIWYESLIHHEVHLAMVMGTISAQEATLVRVHTQSILGDVFGGLHDDAGAQLRKALERIREAGRGVVIYLIPKHSQGDLWTGAAGPGAAPMGDLEEPVWPQLPPPRWDMRDYGVGAQILHDLGVHRMRLMTDHPKRLSGLAGFGLEVVETVATTE